MKDNTHGIEVTRYLTTKTIFLTFISIIGIWIFLHSFAFSTAGSIYPLLTSSLLLLFIVIYGLFNLANKLSSTGTKSESLISNNQDPPEIKAIDESEVIFTLIHFSVFIIVIYFIGFLLSIMVYIYAIQKYYDYGTTVSRIALTLITVGVSSIIMSIIGVRFFDGYIFRILGII